MRNKKKIKVQRFNRMTIHYKRNLLSLAFFVCTTLFISGFQVSPCVATLVWSDNFDDGVIDDWTICTGTFSADGTMLQATGGEDNLHLTNRPSTVAYGTWSFDVYLNTTPDGNPKAFVGFLVGKATCPDVTDNYVDGYGIGIWEYGSGTSKVGYITLVKVAKVADAYPAEYFNYWDDYTYYTFLKEKDVGSVSGWNHIDVTRDSNGQFYVFHDGTLEIEVIDNTYTTSNSFEFLAETWGHAIDNITVDDEISVWGTPSNLQLYSASKAVSVQQNSDDTVSFNVINEGEQPGSGSLTTGTTPNGISVTFNPSTITDLKAYEFDYLQRVEATVTASASVPPGDYEVIVELQNASHVLDTMSLDITILETTVQPTSSAGTSSETQPQDGENTSQGLTIFGVLLTISVIVTLRRKRK